MSKNNKISKALYDLKKNVVNNKLTNINFDTLDLTEVINEKNNTMGTTGECKFWLNLSHVTENSRWKAKHKM